MISDYFKLAFGNLRHRGLRSWLTILGIFIGIAAVVSLITLGAGLREAVIGQFGSISPDVLTIQNKGSGFGPPGSTVVEKLNEHDLKIIGGVSGVKLVVPRLIRVVKIEYDETVSFSYVSDIPNSQEAMDMMYSTMGIKVADGSLLKVGETGRVIVGSEFAKTSEQIFGKKIEVGDKILVNNKSFRVGAILESMKSIQLNSVILFAHEDIKEVLNIGEEYDMIVARVDNINRVEDVSAEISRKLRQDRGEKVGEESFSVQTPLQALGAINTILNIINAIVVGIALISLLVGGIGVANTMYTSVLERTKEIGVMKAIGAKNSDITWIFLIESGLLGLVGGIVGALIGLGIALLIGAVADSALGQDLFRIQINYALLIGAVTFSFVIGIISGVAPAIQASKLKPVEALRK